MALYEVPGLLLPVQPCCLSCDVISLLASGSGRCGPTVSVRVSGLWPGWFSPRPSEHPCIRVTSRVQADYRWQAESILDWYHVDHHQITSITITWNQDWPLSDWPLTGRDWHSVTAAAAWEGCWTLHFEQAADLYSAACLFKLERLGRLGGWTSRSAWPVLAAGGGGALAAGDISSLTSCKRPDIGKYPISVYCDIANTSGTMSCFFVHDIRILWYCLQYRVHIGPDIGEIHDIGDGD
jgi:hypothetical protein